MRPSPVSVPHPTWFCTYAIFYACKHELWNSPVLHLGKTIDIQPALTGQLPLNFCKLLLVFTTLNTPHMPNFYMPTFGKYRNNSKAAPISVYFVWLSSLEKSSFIYISIFSVVNTCVRHRIPSLLHILNGFVHVGSITMLTNRPCHGRWTMNTSRRFHSVSSLKRSLQCIRQKYRYQLFKL